VWTWSLTSWELRRLRVFENRVLKTIFEPERTRQQGSGGDCMMSFVISSTHQILFKWSDLEEWYDRGIWHSSKCLEGFGWPTWRNHPLWKPMRRSMVILKWMEWDTNQWLLWTRLWTLMFHKIRGISRLAEELLTSPEGIYSVELVT